MERLKHATLVLLAGLAMAASLGAQQETEDDLLFLDELRTTFRRGGSWSAQRELREYLEDFPRSVAARRIAAEAALGRGRLEEAESHLLAMEAPDPDLLGRVLLRAGRHEEALELARQGTLGAMAAPLLEVEALLGLGRRSEALRVARTATDGVDDRTLDGHGLLALGRLYLHQRRFELANQALVFADAELNGKRGPQYRLTEPDVLLALGEVYAATRQSAAGGTDPSLDLLNEVLRVDPGHPDALVTKARIYEYGMNGRQVEAALSAALERDPDHAGARVLLGRKRLIDRRPTPALALAERVLDADPRHRDALALRAAVLTVGGKDGLEGAEEARALFTRHHPESAAMQALIGEVMQAHYRFAESVPWLEGALATEPENEDPLSVLAQSYAHLGREEEARAALEDHLRRSPFPYPWRNNMLEVLGKLASAEELVTEGEHNFRIRLPPSEADVLGPLLTQRLEEARADMATRWGVDPPGTVLVEVFDEHADFSVRTVGFRGFLALGACFGDVFTMLSPLSEMRGQFHWAQTAIHEYAHVVTLELSNQRVPRWLTEGVSVVEEKRVDPSWARELDRDVLDARANDMIFPVDRLDEAFRDGQTVMLGYYLGSLVCEVVERDFGFEGLRDLVAAFADGVDTSGAIRQALRIEPAELDRRVLDYIDTELAGRARIRPSWNEDGKEALRRRVAGGDTDALLPLAGAYLDLGRRTDAEAALQRYLEERGETPEAQVVLADRDLADGDRNGARARLETWAAEGSPDADGLQLLARLQIADGDEDAARDSLRRAVALFPGDIGHGGALATLYEMLDPADDAEELNTLLELICEQDETGWQPRVTLAERATAEGNLDEARRRYAEAVEIDPYRPELRLDFADVLLEQGDVKAARVQWQLVLATRQGQAPEPAAVGGFDISLGLLGKDQPPTLPEMHDRARRLLEEHPEPGP
ncbi:MAG: tetratricopeptide repeat protein [Planctomycetota bacterium]|jgi:tetratricopeptide (TPR) repeat protein